MNSREIFKQNQILKQLIQNQQLIEKLRDPLSLCRTMPPTLLTTKYPLDKNHQYTLPDIQPPALLPYQGVDSNESSLSYTAPKKLVWPKTGSAENIEFQKLTHYNPDNLSFH